MKRRLHSGQSLIESCLVLGLICLIFMGLLQVSLIYAGRETLYHSAARGARAKTVGFNAWMVRKAIRAGAIPNAGRMLTPDFDPTDPQLQDAVAALRPGELWDSVLHHELSPPSTQVELELARVPFYLGSDNSQQAQYILDYEDWDTLDVVVDTTDSAMGTPQVRVAVAQDFPLRIPLSHTYFGDDTVRIRGESYIENHYPLYIDDEYW
jgi:hypothetical protein